MAVYIEEPKYLAAGESCVVVEFADEISRAANDAVTALTKHMRSQKRVPLMECLPTYRSLAIYFDPTKTTREAVVKEAKSAPAPAAGGSAAGTEIEIPVCYGGEYGPDIANVAEHAGISEEEVVKRHSAKPCHCYMIGFLPGFAYLGGMDESIATPRLANPRTVIKGGSRDRSSMRRAARWPVLPAGMPAWANAPSRPKPDARRLSKQATKCASCLYRKKSSRKSKRK